MLPSITCRNDFGPYPPQNWLCATSHTLNKVSQARHPDTHHTTPPHPRQPDSPLPREPVESLRSGSLSSPTGSTFKTTSRVISEPSKRLADFTFFRYHLLRFLLRRLPPQVVFNRLSRAFRGTGNTIYTATAVICAGQRNPVPDIISLASQIGVLFYLILRFVPAPVLSELPSRYFQTSLLSSLPPSPLTASSPPS
jgi:hypothetical protein